MLWDQIFSASGTLALLGWAILIVAPHRPALMLGPRIIIPLILAISYGAIMMAHFFQAEGGFGSLVAVRTLFESDALLAAGWQHYLAFDLFVGAWAATRLDAAGVHRLIQTPILIATFMFGPLGFALALLTEGTTRITGRILATATPK